MNERRLVPRVKCRCPAEVRSGTGGRDITLSYAVELSLGGCFVRSNRHMLPGTPLEISLTLEDGARITAQGVVLYDGVAAPASSEPGLTGFAMGFVVIDRESAAKLRAYLMARGASVASSGTGKRQREAQRAASRPRRARKTGAH